MIYPGSIRKPIMLQKKLKVFCSASDTECKRSSDNMAGKGEGNSEKNGQSVKPQNKKNGKDAETKH